MCTVIAVTIPSQKNIPLSFCLRHTLQDACCIPSVALRNITFSYPWFFFIHFTHQQPSFCFACLATWRKHLQSFKVGSQSLTEVLHQFQTGSAPPKWNDPADEQANSNHWVCASDFGMLMWGIIEHCIRFTVLSGVSFYNIQSSKMQKEKRLFLLFHHYFCKRKLC